MTTNTALTIFDPANVPAHIVTFNEEHANIGDKVSVDSLTYAGKIWSVSIGGQKTPLMRKTEDGDEEPRPIIPLVILDYAKRRGRSYYESGFDPDKPQIPTCWSADGITPDASSITIQAEKCAKCPLAEKGSKMTDANKPTTACSQYRMAAVALYRKWELPPLRLRLAITSDYDGQGKDNEAKGWFAFQQLTDLLRSKGVKHTASVVVKAKFDPSVNYPKVLFSPTGWTTQEEIDILAPLAESDAVKQLLSPTFTPNGADNVNKTHTMPQDEGDQNAPQPKTAGGKKPKVQAQPDPEPEPEAETAEDEVEDIVDDAEAQTDEAETEAEDEAAQIAAQVQAQAQAKQNAKVTAAKQAAQARTQPPADEDDDGGEITLNAPTGPKPKPAPAAAAAPKPTAAAPAKAPAAAPKANGAAAPGKAPAAAGKAPAAAAKPAAVSPKVGAMLETWKDDD